MNPRTREEKRALLARFKKPTDLELTLSGIVAEVVPPPVAAWVVAGEVPESIFNSAMVAVQSGGAAVAEALKMPDVFGLAIKIVYGSFKWPTLTPQDEPQAVAPADDQDLLNPYKLPLGDLEAVLVWGISGAKGAMVQTDSGPVTADDLHSFRPNTSLQGNSENGRPIQEESGVGLFGDTANREGVGLSD